MAKFKCEVCGYVYDESIESKPFNQLASDWTCPACGVDKSQFTKE
ncbi:MAG: rubredoxin [Mycoplasmataceae bacterium]|jgi:rubredoxin|nr:rubredoxin [Mycoplasmataceae bacterium]